MVLINNILDVELLGQHIIDGYVSKREHKTLPYVILNYTPECQFNRKWDDVTRQCRGLIYNYETGEVIARPFPKFGNWDEPGYPNPPVGPALRMEKMDGSLGILYRVADSSIANDSLGAYAVATRGSMHSEQAEWASKFYMDEIANQRVEHAFGNGPGEFVPRDDKTYLFEIIYPENRIVVDYGEYKGLVLLDVIDNATGFSDTDEFDNCKWPEKVVRHPVPGFDSGQTADIPEGEEGFVFLWPVKNFRTKMKSADYVHLHRLITGLSKKSVWEALVAGKTANDIKKDLPEEFQKFVDDTVDEIGKSVLGIMLGAQSDFLVINDTLEKKGKSGDRRAFAELASKSQYKSYLFLMLDNRDVYPVALRASKPSNRDSEE